MPSNSVLLFCRGWQALGLWKNPTLPRRWCQPSMAPSAQRGLCLALRKKKKIAMFLRGGKLGTILEGNRIQIRLFKRI